MQENKKIKRPGNRRVLKWLTGIFLLLFFIITILLPPVFSRLIISPALVEGVSQLTSNKYQIQFESLNWSLLGRKIEVDSVRIFSETEVSDSTHQLMIKLDKFSIRKIRYRKLLRGNVNLGLVDVDGLKLYNYNQLPDSLNRNDSSENSFIKSIHIDQVNLDIDSVLFINKSDSLLCITEGSINVDSIVWDSINNNKWPIVEKLSSSIESVYYHHEQELIWLKKLKLEENRLAYFKVSLDQLNYENKEKENNTTIVNPIITIDSIKRQNIDGIKRFSAHEFTLQSDSIFIEQSNRNRVPANLMLENIKQIAKELGIAIQLDNFSSGSNYISVNQPSASATFNAYEIELKSFVFNEQQLDMLDYFVEFDEAYIWLSKMKNQLTFDKLTFTNNRFLFENMVFLPLKDNFEFSSKRLAVNEINWEALLSMDRIDIEKIKLTQPDFTLKEIAKGEKGKLVFPFDIALNIIEIEEANVEIIPESLVLKDVNLIVDSIRGVKNHLLSFDSLFRSLKVNCQDIFVGQEFSSNYFAIKNINVQSLGGQIDADYMTIKQKINHNTAHLISGDFMLKGWDWKSYLRNKEFIYIDSLVFDTIVFKGNVLKDSIKQQKTSVNSMAIKIGFLKLPKTHIDLQLPNKTKLLFENISIEADSLIYSNEHKEPIAFSQLTLKSDKSTLKSSKNSLLFTSEAWDYQSKHNSWKSKNIRFGFENKSDSLKTKLHFDAKIPLIVISGLNPYDYLLDKKIGLDTLIVHQPEFDLIGEKNSKIKKTNALNWQQELRKFVEQYVYVDFKYLEVNKAKFELKNNYLNRRDEINLEEINLNVKGFYLDYQRFNAWDRFLFSDYVEIDFKNYFHSVNSGQFILDVKNAALNSYNRSLDFENISFLSLRGKSGAQLTFNIQDLSFNEFYLNATSLLPELEIESIYINNPDISINPSNRSHENASSINMDSIFVYQGFKNYFNAIDVHQIQVNDCDLKLALKDQLELNDLNLSIDQIRIDSNNQVFSESKFLYANNLDFKIPKYGWVSKNRMYRYEFDQLHINISDKLIELDSLKIISRFDRNTFSANLLSQKDQLDAVFPRILLTGVDFRDALLRKRFISEKIDVFNPELKIYKDKTLKVDTTVVKPMPALQLSKLSFYLNIDSTRVHNGFIKYEEYSGLMNKPGEIYFSDLNLRLTGLSNDPHYKKFGGSLRLLGTAKMLGRSEVSIAAAFPLDSKNQEFTALASMRQLDAVELNPLIQPLTLLSATDGNLMQMQMNIKGNNDYAYGEMLLKYENLKVEVMNKKQKESGLATFLANAFMIRKNNKNFLFPRKGPIYFERVKYRSFVHYLAHFAIIGAKTSIGVDKNKTQRKINEVIDKENK